ncbi:hypothetical protein LWI29_037852 [Acer saccharum]|uniref:NPH3 domain-containing protein n=1 Tax=Acer saccharum TaxID=4024 RepID=A0AA39S791_ACESA|nr:hypothetical protein LWI29_037852 [Acer saccharum]
MARSGVRPDSVTASLMHYAQASLKGIGKCQIWNPARMKSSPTMAENDQRTTVETLVILLPTEKTSSIPLNFLFGMLRMAIMVDATIACKLEIERRIAFRLEMASLDDLLIPSIQTGDSLFDVDTIHRILVNFLQRIEDEDYEDCGYESEGLGSPGHGSLLKVGRLIDSYLAEIAPDPYLSLQKFIAMIEILPDYSRVIDDENDGDAGVINVENPSIHAIVRQDNLVYVTQDLLHDQLNISVVLTTDHVALYVPQTLSGYRAPCTYIVGLHCQPPAQWFTKFAIYALDTQCQAYIKFSIDAMSSVTSTPKIVVIVCKLLGSSTKALESTSDKLEVGKTRVEAEAGKIEGVTENVKVKFRTEEEKVKREGSV